MKMNFKKQFKKYYFRYIIITIFLVFFLFPIVWIFLTSFKSSSEFWRNPPIWIPQNPNWLHYLNVFQQGGLKALNNSLIISTVSTLLSLLVGSMAGYSLARYRIGGNQLPFFILSLRFLPPVVFVFSYFLLFKYLGLLDTLLALIIIHLTFNLPYSVWMMRSFFYDVPVDIEENALVDGCTPFGVFFRIALPLAAPGLIATGIFCFIFSWQEFLYALSFSRIEAVTLPVYMTNFFGEFMVLWGEVGALSTMSVLPLLILSIFVQKYLVRGLTYGAIK